MARWLAELRGYEADRRPAACVMGLERCAPVSPQAMTACRHRQFVDEENIINGLEARDGYCLCDVSACPVASDNGEGCTPCRRTHVVLQCRVHRRSTSFQLSAQNEAETSFRRARGPSAAPSFCLGPAHRDSRLARPFKPELASPLCGSRNSRPSAGLGLRISRRSSSLRQHIRETALSGAWAPTLGFRPRPTIR